MLSKVELPGKPVKGTQIRLAHLNHVLAGGGARESKYFDGGEVSKVTKWNVDTVLKDDGKLVEWDFILCEN